VSFDLLNRTGTAFNLMDSFAGGVLGILAVGPSRLDALRKFTDCMDFVQKQVWDWEGRMRIQGEGMARVCVIWYAGTGAELGETMGRRSVCAVPRALYRTGGA
jgi:hypothetical protein